MQGQRKNEGQMKLELQQYAALTHKPRSQVRREITAEWDVSRQGFDQWWDRGKPVITLHVDPRNYAIRKIDRGEVVEVPRRSE